MRKGFLSVLLVLLAMGAGVWSGLSESPLLMGGAGIVSDLFMRLLKLVSLPLIFLAITSTVSGMSDFKEMRTLGKRVFLYTVGTTIVAAVIALALFLLIDPVRTTLTTAGEAVVAQDGSYMSFFLNIIPSNFAGAFIESNVIGIAFLGFALSISILFLPKAQKEFLHQLFSSLFAATIKMTSGILVLMPLAIWAFMSLLVKDLGQSYAHMQELGLYLACVTAANFIQGLIILPLLLRFKKVPVLKSAKGMLPALIVAFFSKSSNATLPVTMRSLEKNLCTSPRVTNFAIPLCSVINMNGCAAFILTTTLFVSMLHGMTFSPFELGGWVILATLAAIGNAGIPMGCFFLTSAFLMGMHVPLYMMGIILPFYTLLDMVETTLNVWSDACVTLVVDKELSEQTTEDLPALKEV